MGQSKASGKIVDAWDFEKPKIDDKDDKKPSDWVDEEMMDDPEDKKPEGYDDIPAKIADPKATNPDYKGEWKAKRIKNPAYKGVWEAKLIANPKYAPDDKLYLYEKFSTVGIDVWQVKSGTIFDNILITDDVAYAKEHAEKTWKAQKDGEKAAKEKADEEKRKKDEEERKKKEEEDKKKKEEEDAKKAEEGGDEEKKDEEKKEL